MSTRADGLPPARTGRWRSRKGRGAGTADTGWRNRRGSLDVTRYGGTYGGSAGPVRFMGE
ncbi:hypothetical protein GCM10010331_11660 [Streptomyces xanthochromogenes]|nr:hypothetical protein GCM10010331_11660 [Streptomyces xanthochromogenes]